MASLADVLNAVTSLLQPIIYPSGINQPSIAGVPVRIYAGWPNPQQLDVDLKAATCHVSVYPRNEEKNTTRFSPDFELVSVATATVTLTQNGQQITVGGAMPSPFTAHNLAIISNGTPYVYTLLSSDTLTSAAASLAALIPSATASNGVITLPNSANITAVRVGVTGTAYSELRRQQRNFQFTVWADTPTNRDSIANAMDSALSALRFIALPDSSKARIIYQSSPMTDSFQGEKLYRRDFIYSIEYGTFQTETETQITAEQLNLSALKDGATAYTASLTRYL